MYESYKVRAYSLKVSKQLGEKAIYKYGASDMKYQHLRANNLLMWEAIKWYSQNGFKIFNFGITSPENIGLRQYKNGWGVKEQIIKYFKYDLSKNILVRRNNKLYGLHNAFFKRMPVAISKAFGALLYKYIG